MKILEKHMIKYVWYNGCLHVLIDDVAKLLNYTNKSKENRITWDRINKYLNSIGYLEKVHSNSYIPLNVFYKLVFMTNTKQAKELKNEIADIISDYINIDMNSLVLFK